MTELTDEQLQNMDDEEFEQAQTSHDEVVENAEPVSEDTEGEPEVSGSKEIVKEASTTEEVKNEESTTEEVTSEETETEDDAEVVDGTEEDIPADNETEEKSPEEESPSDKDTEFDYKASYTELMKPLKVSGKDTQVKSIDDMRNLAMMGIDYSRKMRDIKPLRAVGETLAQAGIIKDGTVDEEALTRLVDINNGNVDAIAQLMKDNSIDPLDMDTENVDYTSQTTMATPQSMEIQDVERELISRGSVDSIISELNKMDDKSKQFFNETPQNLLMLENDISNGSYERIMGAVNYEKSLGRLGDMSDMEAYIQIAQQEDTPSEKIEEVKTPTKPKPSTKKRKAAAITKRAPAKKTVQKTYDYESMSDEEFEKLAMSNTIQY